MERHGLDLSPSVQSAMSRQRKRGVGVMSCWGESMNTFRAHQHPKHIASLAAEPSYTCE
jgi:hypothetical protein